jgi:hypothetical protein
MQNGSLKIGVVQNYTHTNQHFPYLTTIYPLQVDILQTFNQLSNYKFLDSCHLLSIFALCSWYNSNVLASSQSGMGPTGFWGIRKGARKRKPFTGCLPPGNWNPNPIAVILKSTFHLALNVDIWRPVTGNDCNSATFSWRRSFWTTHIKIQCEC